MNIRKIVKENNLEELFNAVKIGIEKEGQRVLESGDISKTGHPKTFGIRQKHPYIQTDFAESQIELITSPENSEKNVLRYLAAIHEVVLKNLPKDEFIWPLSIPVKLPNEEDIKVAQFEDKWDVEYREYLVKKYGKYKQMVSGIHYNFQLSDNLMKSIADIEKKDIVDVKNNIYMKLARQFIRYQWLLVYLYGASPLVEDKYYYNSNDKPKDYVRSIRMSRFGYVNDEDIVVSYNSLEEYIDNIVSYVETGKLIAEKEFYSSVRFRGEDTVKKFLNNGIKYIEFRLFDLNPYAPFGILEKDIRFIHLFIKTLVWLDEKNAVKSVEIGKEYSEKIALAHPLSKPEYLEEGLELLDNMKEMVKELKLSEADLTLIEEKENELIDSTLTIGGRLVRDYKNTSPLEVGMKLAKKYKKQATENYYSLKAFENMELSTQALIEDAIRNGIKVDIIDENDQFIRLEWNNQVEYVKNGNMTSRDSYISPLIMENKIVTKKILAEQGFRVPKGYEVSTLDDAVMVFNYIKNKPVVIKPKSTNFGLGITIFKYGINDIETYSEAINLALKEDKDVIIEEFIEGTEYRFFVIEGKTKAVLLRVPANVVGDGVHTIEELVEIKNNSSLRGDAKKTPLKKLELGEIEQLQLKEQGLTIHTVLKKGQVANLRENSNISTGGDSIDMTDEVHSSYKKLAVKISDAMLAKVCGVDLIIPDIKSEVDNNNYGVIEANFNPMMMMHIYPYKGKSRRLSLDVLRMLFPDKNII
ncbi:bifunctional glutamate--cysteine ligase/glutathione synthetase [Gemella sp. oral taxon 928]|uniref:bifunctional glutamate--cysteine ligase GshA/glutathione synthetase GshB n=1 Tax=unclassified Gemella TaxID=2624949 RepID=UPI000768222B|nr:MULTISPECIES: bifunctional glutamate--cysteine ligase GshA/glutathione synthetase GshB [unclassified Gemella]AME09966.1 bifunctional glutamate--cysteine ligase/glutathione synthetase [Gemella sp. oral taxon 928]AXI26106.1 bifunctional glutamate--cysteine ligase/glutathione synthetase [Gemella sp. ND 6198]